MARYKSIETQALGTIYRTTLEKRIREAGSQAKLARQLNVAESTVRNWRLRLKKETSSL